MVGNGIGGSLRERSLNTLDSLVQQLQEKGVNFIDFLSEIRKFPARFMYDKAKAYKDEIGRLVWYSLLGYQIPSGAVDNILESAINKIKVGLQVPYDSFTNLLEKAGTQIANTEAYREFIRAVDETMIRWNDFITRMSAKYHIWKDGNGYKISRRKILKDDKEIGRFVPGAIGEAVEIYNGEHWKIAQRLSKIGIPVGYSSTTINSQN